MSHQALSLIYMTSFTILHLENMWVRELVDQAKIRPTLRNRLTFLLGHRDSLQIIRVISISNLSYMIPWARNMLWVVLVLRLGIMMRIVGIPVTLQIGQLAQ